MCRLRCSSAAAAWCRGIPMAVLQPSEAGPRSARVCTPQGRCDDTAARRSLTCRSQAQEAEGETARATARRLELEQRTVSAVAGRCARSAACLPQRATHSGRRCRQVWVSVTPLLLAICSARSQTHSSHFLSARCTDSHVQGSRGPAWLHDTEL